MREAGRQKKSETIEIRLAHATKQAFMARCRAAGRSASDELRGFIADYLEGGAPSTAGPARRVGTVARLGAAAAALLAAGALAGPTLARPSLPAAFERLDANHDGRLSFGEFSRAATVSVSLGAGAARPLTASPADAPASLILRAEFDRIDTNHDGELSFAEFRRYYAPPAS
jgi:hypothetical protein